MGDCDDINESACTILVVNIHGRKYLSRENRSFGLRI